MICTTAEIEKSYRSGNSSAIGALVNLAHEGEF